VATRAKAGGGSVLAFGLGLLLIVGIAGTPFYARFLQSNEDRLSDQVKDDVESIRRLVLNVDENLAAMAQMAEARGVGKDSKSPEDLLAENPAMLDAVKPDLDASTRALKKAADEDQKRNLKLPGSDKIATGAPKPAAAFTELQRKYAVENDNYIKEARKIASNLKNAAQGDVRAADLLSVNRILAILSLVEGRVNASRAAFERSMAADLRREAERRLTHVQDLKMSAVRAEAEKPSVDMERVTADLAKTEDELSKLDDRIAQLKSEIAAKESAVASARASAEAARASMAAMNPTAIVGATGQQYQALSDQARKAEATVASLENGTLDGGELPLDAADDLLHGKYEGGTAAPGLRDLKGLLAQLEAQHETLSSVKSELTTRRSALEERDNQLASARSDLTGEAAKHADEIMSQLETAEKLDDSADKLSETAVKLFKEASGHARKAASAASARRRTAQQSGTSAPGAPEKAADRLVKDNDTEAAMHVLAGELSYQIAMEDLRKIRALEMHQAARSSVADVSGADKPADVAAEIDAARKEGLEEIEQSLKSFATAAGMIKGGSFKGLDGPSISGTQTVWQVQVAQAAAGLLKSQLLAEAVDADTARSEAYTFLGEAVKGREGSPLLTPALSTYLYLQKNAK